MNHRDIDRHLTNIANTNLATLGNQLHDAHQTSRTHRSTPDGYPTTTGGSGAGNSELTPVEAAAEWLLTHPNPIDAYDRIVRDACHHLAHTDAHLTACRNKLTQLARLQDDAGLAPTEPGCWALARIGSWEAVAHTIVIAGDPHPLGNWAYLFHRRNGRLPTIDECRRRARGDKIYMKAS
jgi:hypothetical protein